MTDTTGPASEPGDAASDEAREDAATHAGDATDEADERLLRAVREEVLAVGLRRVTATSVARRAGLARVTLYRRGGGVKRLILSALTLEAEAVVRSSLRDLPEGTGLERTTELCLRLMRDVGASDFLQAVITVDPRLVEPYLTDHLGASQRALVRAVRPELERGIADGSIVVEDPQVLAVVLLHALTPFAMASRLTRVELGQQRVREQIVRLIGGYLAPSTRASALGRPRAHTPSEGEPS